MGRGFLSVSRSPACTRSPSSKNTVVIQILRTLPKLPICFAILFLALAFSAAAAFPTFATDITADQWLREKSASYRKMAETVDGRGGYQFIKTVDFPKAVAIRDGHQRFIALNDRIQGAERVSTIVFELTNLFQDDKHTEVDWDIVHGRIQDASHYAILREAIECDGLRLHRTVLTELEAVIGTIPPEMLRFVGHQNSNLASYGIPLAYDVIQGSRRSGHSKVHRERFAKCMEELKARQEK